MYKHPWHGWTNCILYGKPGRRQLQSVSIKTRCTLLYLLSFCLVPFQAGGWKKKVLQLSLNLSVCSLQSHTDKLSSQISSQGVLICWRHFSPACPHLICLAGWFWYPFLNPFCSHRQKLGKGKCGRSLKGHFSMYNEFKV